MSWALALVALQAVFMVPTPQPRTPGPTPVPGVPSAIVDRIVETPGERTRLSLFSNGVAVVSVRHDGSKAALFKRTLSREVLVGYLVALEESARQIRALYSIPQEPGEAGGTVTIRLHAGPGDPILMRFRTVQMMPLAVGRLGTILDDLQTKVMATPPGYDEVMAWHPREGDEVEMVTGQKARVVEVRHDGTVIVEYENVGLSELVTPAERPRRIRHVLTRTGP